MPTYHYELTNAAGQPICGSASATSLPALASQMASQGWELTHVLPDPSPKPRRYWRRVSNAELATFLRDLASMLKNDVPVPEALSLLARECRNPVLQTILHSVEGHVRSGEPLSGALSRFPRLFGPMQTGMLESGESSNTLEQVAGRLADYTEKVSEARRRILNAAYYPSIVCTASLALLCFAFMFVVPRYMELMRELGVKEVPALTMGLVFMGQWVAPFALMLAVPAALIFVLSLVVQRGNNPWRLDRLKLRLPILGKMFEALALYRLSSMLAIFLDTRMPLLDALRLAGQGTDNTVFQGALWNAIPRVAGGEPLGRALDESGHLPPSFCGQVSVAETNGNLPDTLSRLATSYSERIDGMAARVGALLEPALIVGVGLCVGWVALGLFLPLIQILRSLSGGE